MIIFVAFLVGSSATTAATDVTGPLGCYLLEATEWSPSLDLGEDARYIVLPKSIQFTEEPSEFGGEWKLLKYIPGEGAAPMYMNAWRSKGEAVETVFSDGYVGFNMQLDVSEADLHGIATTRWDFGRSKQKSTIHGKKIDCSGAEG